MGKLIKFPMNELMQNFYIDEQFREFYDGYYDENTEEEIYYDSESNENKKEVCLLSKLIKKIFCK